MGGGGGTWGDTCARPCHTARVGVVQGKAWKDRLPPPRVCPRGQAVCPVGHGFPIWRGGQPRPLREKT